MLFTYICTLAHHNEYSIVYLIVRSDNVLHHIPIGMSNVSFLILHLIFNGPCVMQCVLCMLEIIIHVAWWPGFIVT